MEKLCCFPQHLHRPPKFALNSNLKCKSRITLIYPGGGCLFGCFGGLLLSSDFNLTNCLQAQNHCWLVAFSFTIPLVSWFMLPAFRACYGKFPPFPQNPEDLSTFTCLGLWKYTKQLPYRKKQTIQEETNWKRHPSLAIDPLPWILNRLQISPYVIISVFHVPAIRIKNYTRRIM